MANLDMVLEKQLLTLRNREIISSGDVNVDSCRFVFDGEWEGYTKTAVFYQDRRTSSMLCWTAETDASYRRHPWQKKGICTLECSG